jgi:hypothetical protein
VQYSGGGFLSTDIKKPQTVEQHQLCNTPAVISSE